MLMPLGLMFVGILVLCSGMVLVVGRPSRAETAVVRRLDQIVARESAETSTSAQLIRTEKTVGSAWLEHRLEKLPGWQKLVLLGRQANCSASASSILALSICLGVTSLTFFHLFFSRLPALLGFAIAAVSAAAPFAYLAFRRARRLRAFEIVLPDAVDTMARGLRAGHSTVSALEMMAQQAAQPVGVEFMTVFIQQNLGLPLRDALNQLCARVPSQDLRVVATAMMVQKDTGGNLAEVLEQTVAVIRDRLRIRGEIRTQTAQGRLTGWILTLLPAVMLFLINLVDPGYSRLLIDDPGGRKLIYAGLVLMALGGYFIHRITTGIEV